MAAYLDVRESAIGIYDGTNTTLARRNWIREECKKKNYLLIFV